MIPRPPISTLFPYTTLVRSNTSIESAYVRMNDPRVPIGNKNRSSVTGIPLFFQKKFASMSSPIRLASGDEARRSEEHTSELQSHSDLVCRLLLEKKNDHNNT